MVEEKSQILRMSIWVLIVNLGLLSISITYAGISHILTTYPAKVEILMVVGMVVIIFSKLFISDFVMFRIRFVLGSLLVLLANEVYYIVMWNSPSVQLLSFVMLLFGLLYDMNKILRKRPKV